MKDLVRIVTVRKDHHCDSIDDEGFQCPRTIKKGEKAKVESTKIGRVSGSGSYWTTSYYHLKCPMRERI